MKLDRIKIHNFKSIGAAGVDLVVHDEMTVLVGMNNSGKSNIVDAIGMLFGYKNPRYLDYPISSYNDPAREIIIEAEFSGIDFGAGKRLGFSNAQCAMLTKPGKSADKVPGHLTLRLCIPPMEEEAEDEEEDDRKRSVVIYLANKHEVKKTEKLRKALVRHISVPAVRSEAKLLKVTNWTAYGQLVRDLVHRDPRLTDLEQLVDEASRALEAILEEQAQQLSEAAELTTYVERIRFQLTKEGDPAELLQNLSIMVESVGRWDDIAKMGTGTQSLVILAILELSLRNRAREGSASIFLVEEPELFLHPHAQRYVTHLLRRIAASNGIQVVLTTHSAASIMGAPQEGIRRIERDVSGTRCLAVDTKCLDTERMRRVLDSTTAEMFFADRVVLVEGPTEKVLIPRLAKIITERAKTMVDPDRLNVSVVSTGGRENFKDLTAVLDSLNIGWRIVTDRDAMIGSTLMSYKERAGVDPAAADDKQLRGLRGCGVAVLRDGEIEDYYPKEALAAIGGCSIQDVDEKIEEYKQQYDAPSVLKLVTTIINAHHGEIHSIEKERLPKVVQRWYSQAIEALRQTEEIGAGEPRKTGEALSSWLKMPKPLIAERVVEWMESPDGRVSDKLEALVKWLIIEEIQPQEQEI